jgi:hypothetical protein
LLIAIGLANWAEDTVTAKGFVFGKPVEKSVANLSFNYEAFAGKEFEVLNYIEGDNWLDYNNRHDSVTHLGMHCSAEELVDWIVFFDGRGIGIAQQVLTLSHTNQFLIENGRKYNYVIFDTRSILGVDLKLIVRIEKE